MYYSLTQICLQGRDFDIEGWKDILVLVVVAVVYVLGAIIKATKNKKAEEQKQQALEQQDRKPQRKPAKGGRGLFEQFIMEVKKAAEEARAGTETRPSGQTAAQKKVQAKSVLQKYTTQTKQQAPVQPKVTPAKPKVSKPATYVQPDFDTSSTLLDKGIQGLPDISTRLVGLSGQKEAASSEVVESMYLSDVLADYEDSEELKRAILHYEILGRPLALRDPSAGIIGLY